LDRKNKYVFDSYAVIGFLEDEPFAGRIEKLLQKARNDDVQLFLHAIHLGEIYYIAMREQGQQMADMAYSRIKSFPLKYIESISEELLLTSATLKARFPISYADAFAAGMAVTLDCPLLSGDLEFEKLENEGILAVAWLR
jgi:predicted nucleic acid-binding protein